MADKTPPTSEIDHMPPLCRWCEMEHESGTACPPVEPAGTEHWIGISGVWGGW